MTKPAIDFENFLFTELHMKNFNSCFQIEN